MVVSFHRVNYTLNGKKTIYLLERIERMAICFPSQDEFRIEDRVYPQLFFYHSHLLGNR